MTNLVCGRDTAVLILVTIFFWQAAQAARHNSTQHYLPRHILIICSQLVYLCAPSIFTLSGVQVAVRQAVHVNLRAGPPATYKMACMHPLLFPHHQAPADLQLVNKILCILVQGLCGPMSFPVSVCHRYVCACRPHCNRCASLGDGRPCNASLDAGGGQHRCGVQAAPTH